MIAFIIQGIQKNLSNPEQYYAYIMDSDDSILIENTKNIFNAFIKNSLNNIDIISYLPFSSDAAIDAILEYTEDCSQFFGLPSEVALSIIERFKV